MNSYGFLKKIAKLFFCVSILFIIPSCGSFQGASYFASDGIYVSNQENITEDIENRNDYYSQYFSDVADGYIDETSQENYFIDSENYTSLDKNKPVIVDGNISQIPWGQQTNETEIIIVNNSPNYLWGLSNFAFRFSPFWNSYYSDPFRFGYGYNLNPFYNPYMNTFYQNSGYNSYAGYWGGYNTYFNPYNRYAGFYSPFRYGNYWNNKWNRSNNSIVGYVDNQYDSTVARIKSGRGEKNYPDSTVEKGDKQSRQSNPVDIQKTIDLVNLGRGVNSLSRNLFIGSSIARNNINGAKSFGRSKTARPYINTNEISGRSRSQNNPSNSIENSNNERFSQSRFNSKEKNKSNTTSPKRTTRNPNRSRRYYTPISSKNKLNNTSRSYNNRSNNNTQTRSYNSSSSNRKTYSSSGSSSSRSSPSGSKSSGGGRRN